jgi:spore maturation protein CgeE
MDILSKVIECEIEYLKCFCKLNQQPNFIRFQDDLMPDYWSHNYTWIKSADNDTELLQLIESELSHSKNIGRNFCFIRCHIPINHSLLALLSAKPEVSKSGYYVFSDISNLSLLDKVKDSYIIKVDTAKMLADILALDLEHDGENTDFCTRRVYRRKDIYLSNDGVDSYVCYHNEKPVGNCDLFVHNGIVKVEDFAISPNHQRKGFGATLLKAVTEIAFDNMTIQLVQDK